MSGRQPSPAARPTSFSWMVECSSAPASPPSPLVTQPRLLRAGDVIYSGSGDRTCRVWRPDAKNPLQIFEGHRRAIFALAYGNETLFSASEDKTVFKHGEPLQVFKVCWAMRVGHCHCCCLMWVDLSCPQPSPAPRSHSLPLPILTGHCRATRRRSRAWRLWATCFTAGRGITPSAPGTWRPTSALSSSR